MVQVSAGDVGELLKIRLHVDPRGRNPNWLLSKVKVKDIHSKQEFHFEYGDWIRQHRHETGEMIVELPAVRPDIPPFPSATTSTNHTRLSHRSHVSLYLQSRRTRSR